MRTLKELKKFVKDCNNNLQGYSRTLIVDNLDIIEREINKKERLLEMVLEDLEDGQLTQIVINKIKNNLK